jgi:Phorbol esters/diacylglycerol binding domain (C1 domain)
MDGADSVGLRARLHSYRLISLSHPTWCSLCNKFILGVYKQALTCTHCESTIHKECEVVSLLKTVCGRDASR